jgi:hypothetical protein
MRRRRVSILGVAWFTITTTLLGGRPAVAGGPPIDVCAVFTGDPFSEIGYYEPLSVHQIRAKCAHYYSDVEACGASTGVILSEVPEWYL